MYYVIRMLCVGNFHRLSALLVECDEDWMTGKIYLNRKD